MRRHVDTGYKKNFSITMNHNFIILEIIHQIKIGEFIIINILFIKMFKYSLSFEFG
jgi:hypothetical protein